MRRLAYVIAKLELALEAQIIHALISSLVHRAGEVVVHSIFEPALRWSGILVLYHRESLIRGDLAEAIAHLLIFLIDALDLLLL